MQTTQQASSATPLQRAIAGAPIGESFTADFKKDTWTFKVPAYQPVQAGRYVLLPVVVADLAIAQERAETANTITLAPVRNGRATFRPIGDQPSIRIEFDGGISLTLYRDLQPPKYNCSWNPAHWSGSEKRLDQFGETWAGPHKTYVQDDFGTLVEVAA